jgi:PleD family two-component response regulator
MAGARRCSVVRQHAASSTTERRAGNVTALSLLQPGAEMRRVLVVGRSTTIMERVHGLLESAGYTPIEALTDDAALALMTTMAPDALLIGGGVEGTSRRALAAAFAAARPGRPVIEHFGGPTGLLEAMARALP